MLAILPMSFLNQVLEQHFLYEITGPRDAYVKKGR
jgi:hypothetical protein